MLRRRLLFAGLYFAQGVPWGFVTVVLMSRLLDLGLGRAAMGGLVGLAVLPWTCKPLVGPLVDRLGRRRPLILSALAAMAASLLVLAQLTPMRAPLLFATMMVVHNACAALQDVATDALALDVLPVAERGRANGAMFAGKWLGTLVGGSALAWVASRAGWGAASGLALGLLLLPALLVLGVDEPARARPPFARAALRSLFNRGALLLVTFLLISGAGDALLYPVLMSLLRGQLALSDDRFSLVILIAGATSALGALAGGRLADTFGRRRVMVVTAVVLALTHLGWAAAPWGRFSILISYEVLASLASGALGAATLGLCMDLTDPRLTATQFQLFMAVVGVRSAWATPAGGLLSERLPAPAMFVVAAAVELAPLYLLALLPPAPPDRAMLAGP